MPTPEPKISYAIQANRIPRRHGVSRTGGWMTIFGAEYTDREQAERVFATKPKKADNYYGVRLVEIVNGSIEVIS